MRYAVDVSVLVPVRDERALIATTARTILAQRFDGAIELLMIEGGSRDGTRAELDRLASEDERVRVLENPRGDLASALCIGLDAASGEFVAKMDAHTYFPPDYLRIGVDRLRRGDVNWVSGPPIPYGVDRCSRAVALALGTRLGMGGSGKWAASFSDGGSSTADRSLTEEKQLDTGVFSGVWRRSVLERLGGWQPDWPVNEDSELASRYLAAGERILCLRSMGARYVPRSTLRGLARQYWRYGFYRAKTANRHPDSMRPLHLAPAGLVMTVLAAPISGRRGRRLIRVALASYATAQLWGIAGVARGGERGGERCEVGLLPGVFTTMHASFGAGWLTGCLRFGFPHAALRAMLARLLASASPDDRPSGIAIRGSTANDATPPIHSEVP
jgi:succinoglycan biosynthesis protein ExoA